MEYPVATVQQLFRDNLVGSEKSRLFSGSVVVTL